MSLQGQVADSSTDICIFLLFLSEAEIPGHLFLVNLETRGCTWVLLSGSMHGRVENVSLSGQRRQRRETWHQADLSLKAGSATAGWVTSGKSLNVSGPRVPPV